MRLRRTAIAPPDPRYLRRRGNLRVRKARRARSVLQFLAILLAHLLALSLLVLAGSRALAHLAGSPMFKVRTVRVSGMARGSERALRQRLESLSGRGLLELDLDDVARLAGEDPWVRRASVNRLLPDTLHVQVEERVPAAVAVIRGRTHVVDREGVVVGPCGPAMSEDAPVLVGLDGLDAPALGAALARGVRALAELERVGGDFVRGVAEIDLGQPDRIAVRHSGTGPILLLDPQRVGRNLKQYVSLSAVIADRAGPAQYVDLRWSERIAVMPAPSQPETMER
jgi:cell division septal protein FtsQ